jgi:hypothetical protein
VIQGQVIETGLGFTLTVDYNRFREIFRKRTEEEKALRRKYRQEQKEKDKAKEAADKAAAEKAQNTPTS